MSAPGEFTSGAVGYQMPEVTTISDIRHANLLLLIAKAGTVQALADALDKSHSQISQLKNRSARKDGARKPRTIGDGLAREMEDKLGLPSGWMDQPQPGAYATGSVVWASANDLSARRTIGEVAAAHAADQVIATAKAPSMADAMTLLARLDGHPDLLAQAAAALANIVGRVQSGEFRPATGTNGH